MQEPSASSHGLQSAIYSGLKHMRTYSIAHSIAHGPLTQACGMQAIGAKNYTGPPSLNDRSPQMELLGQLIHDLDAEGRYLLINALANQLRYPNSHTHYFSWTLLLLFHEAQRVRL